MPAKNIDHDAVRDALIADGWTITDDPLIVEIGDRKLYIDLGLERRTIGAQKNDRRIAVEVQSFLNVSPLSDFYRSVGQYLAYRAVLKFTGEDRELLMAIPSEAARGFWAEPLGQLIGKEYAIRILEYSTTIPRILTWTA